MAEKPTSQFGRVIGRHDFDAYNEDDEPVEIETRNTIYRRAG